MSQVPRSFRIIKEENVPVPMRDGVTLRADVFRPDP
jgi:predicted acyl esterase